MKTKMLEIVIIALGFVSCQAKSPVLKGNLEGVEFNKIYLCEVISEYYKHYKPIDSAQVINNTFEFDLSGKSSQLFFLGNGTNGGMLFIEPGPIEVIGTSAKDIYDEDLIKWTVKGCSLHDKYLAYNHVKDSISQASLMDELTKEFYEAREAGNESRMKELRDEQGRIMNATDPLVKIWNKNSVEGNTDNALGPYLHLTTQFYKQEYLTRESVAEAREFLMQFSPKAQESVYMDKMQIALDAYDACAIGQVAPEITGVDTTGVSRKLSDFRGKYVIVDFWSSTCRWCRYETPNLLKAYEMFKDKGFTILGVSSDWKKDMWMNAIHEDKSYWDQIILEKKDINATMDRYCIRGIPHIILVGPDGVILEKELRGEAIYKVPGKYIK